jgi:hypothetical protein
MPKLYDYLLTLYEEITIVWFTPWNHIKILFFLVRYIPIVALHPLFAGSSLLIWYGRLPLLIRVSVYGSSDTFRCSYRNLSQDMACPYMWATKGFFFFLLTNETKGLIQIGVISAEGQVFFPMTRLYLIDLLLPSHSYGQNMGTLEPESIRRLWSCNAMARFRDLLLLFCC